MDLRNVRAMRVDVDRGAARAPGGRRVAGFPVRFGVDCYSIEHDRAGA
ncbi:MAG TPA: hypothetical protein VIP05_04430 [Burkholderiaceae bacterium]